MDYFSNDPNADAIIRMRGGMAEVKHIMIENIEKVIIVFTLLLHDFVLSTYLRKVFHGHVDTWIEQLLLDASSLFTYSIHLLLRFVLRVLGLRKGWANWAPGR